MNLSKATLVSEFITLFLVIPVLLALPIHIAFKLSILVIALIYIIYRAHLTKLLRWRIFLPEGKVNSIIWWRFSIFVVLSTIIVIYYFPELLFKVVIEDPMLWIVILFIYTLFSVLPQEWLYRYVYVRRYRHMLPKGIPGTLLNGLIFSLAHLLFWNHFVLLLTFIGGCLFYHTYLTTRSLFQASLEHTLYGLWLFTLGIGDMLAFPG